MATDTTEFSHAILTDSCMVCKKKINGGCDSLKIEVFYKTGLCIPCWKGGDGSEERQKLC